MPPPRRLLPVFAGLLGLAVLTASCGGGSSHQDPASALKTARTTLEKTSGIHLLISTSDLPGGVQGLKSADGTVTDAPAYDGTLGVVTELGSVSVPVRSVGGKVYAKIPLTLGWSTVNPSDYGAPDPAQLLSTDNGVPALLAATTGATSGKAIRGGTDHKEVLSVVTGTVPGSAVASIIPGASGGTFRAAYALAAHDQLRQVSLTGTFYAGHAANTYTLVLLDYGTKQTITAP
jgi:lipoprotein LprG